MSNKIEVSDLSVDLAISNGRTEPVDTIGRSLKRWREPGSVGVGSGQRDVGVRAVGNASRGITKMASVSKTGRKAHQPPQSIMLRGRLMGLNSYKNSHQRLWWRNR